MNCRECREYIDAYIDNELDVATVILVKQHLRECAECQATPRISQSRGRVAERSTSSL